MEHTPANSNIIDLVDSPPPQQKSCIPVLQLSQRLKNAQLDAANSRGKPKIMIEKFGNYENKVKRNPSAIGNYENDVKRNPSANNKRKYVDESDPETPSESNDTEDDGDILVTSKLPPPGQRIVHPKTGAVYENVTQKVYKRAKEGDLDCEGYTIPRSQHRTYLNENEDFVIYARRNKDVQRYSYQTDPGEFARIGFFKKIQEGNESLKSDNK